MKLIFLLIAANIMILSATPCSDLNTYFGKASTHQSSSNAHENHEHHDDCTPFCSCTCCTTGTIAQSDFYSDVILTDIYNSYTDFVKIPSLEINFVSSFYGDIWQPPKI